MSHTDNKPKILIVDDEKIILDLTSIILRNRGYEVVTASDADAGFHIIEQAAPELVLLDYMMPSMDGLTALKKIKREMPDTYVIMFTGKGSEEIAVELMKAGASDYILKPFNNQDLCERISNVLRIRKIELANRQLRQERDLLLEEIAGWNLELEDRVQEKTEELQRAQAEIVQSEKLATLGYLSAGMAHEIRNPLNSIALFVQLLRTELDDPEQLSYTDKVLTEVERIDSILKKLLDASKRPRYEIGIVHVDRVIEKTLDVFKPQTQHNNIQVVRDYIKLPPPIQADSSEIEQIFTNLFLNSIHEMAGGGTLTIQLDHDDEAIYVKVSDTGKGIPKQNLSNIFDPFFTTKKCGTGLGLSVVLRIVKTYKGCIDVEETAETGTTFRIRLPISPCDASLPNGLD